MKKRKQFLAMILSFAVISAVLSGCGGSDLTEELYRSKVDTSKTVTEDSRWINSDFVGAVTEDTNVSLKDDFYTAVNKEWFLEVEDRLEKEKSVGELSDNEGIVLKQELELLNKAREGSLGENKIGMEADAYNHLKEIFSTFTKLAADWNERNAEGIKPLEPYIQQIENIQNIEELTTYLINADGSFVSGAYPIKFSVDASWEEDDATYTVMIKSDFENYSSTDTGLSDYEYHELLRRDLYKMLSEYGYSKARVNRMLKNCWKYEAMLKERSSYKEVDTSKIENSMYFNNVYSKEELKEMAGNYPLLEILSTYNYDESGDYTVWEPDFVRGVGKLYTEKNLSIMKDYFLVHTIINSMQYLSRDCYESYKECFVDDNDKIIELLTEGGSTDPKDSTDSDGGDTDTSDHQEQQLLNEADLTEDEEILIATVSGSLRELSQEMYAANYCSSEQKEYLKNLLSDLVDSYKEILNNEDWLSAETKEKAIEKLEKMTFLVLYPDTLNDYRELDITGLNLVQSVAAVREYNLRNDAKKISQQADKQAWDLSDETIATTTVNAYYRPSGNSAVIMAGIVALDKCFSLDASYEENLAHIGVIMGHEISHAFDSTGYMYDTNGELNKWWDNKDIEVFQEKVDKVAKYYSSYSIYRDGDYINGSNVVGEATADMGGMRCALNLASKCEDFDYEKFFLSYAKTFVSCQNFATEIAMFKDVHPVSFLRCNAVVQQFEEFYDAFDVKEEDGMYLAPDKRVAVW